MMRLLITSQSTTSYLRRACGLRVDKVQQARPRLADPAQAHRTSVWGAGGRQISFPLSRLTMLTQLTAVRRAVLLRPSPSPGPGTPTHLELGSRPLARGTDLRRFWQMTSVLTVSLK